MAQLSPASKSRNGSLENSVRLNSKRQSLGPDFDETSSVTSMSSTSRARLCHACKEEEVLPSKFLIRCSSCKGRWHKFCHNPIIRDTDATDDWHCARCISKSKNIDQNQPTGSAKPDFATPSVSSRPARGEASKQKVCEFIGCKGLNPQLAPDGKLLCSIHMMMHARSETAYSEIVPRPALSSFEESPTRPIHKMKSYPDKLDGLKQLKRKRSALDKNKRSSHDETSELNTHEKISSLGSNTDVGPSRHIARKSAFDPVVYGFTRHVGSSSAIESPVGPKNRNSTNAEPRASKSASITPQLQSSSEYLPPPPTNTDCNLWEREMSPEGNPSAQISRELKKTTQRNSEDLNRLAVDRAREARLDQAAQTIRATRIVMISQPDLTARNSSSTSEAAKPTEGIGPKAPLIISKQPPSIPIVTAQESSSEDVEMTDVVTEDLGLSISNGVIDEVSLPGKPNDTRDTGASIDTISPSERDKIIDTNIDIDQPSRDKANESQDVMADIDTRSSRPINLETIRQQNTAEYDQSTLDSFLASQARKQEGIYYQPSFPNFIPSQLWGHIDPRDSWSEEHTPKWLEAKKAEIKSRGGRKANFGKHLTAQVIKERRERGWSIHQNREAPDDGEEAARHIKELFDIKLSDLEPGLINGQLVVREKSVDENGKKRKKNAIRAFPVC